MYFRWVELVDLILHMRGSSSAPSAQWASLSHSSMNGTHAPLSGHRNSSLPQPPFKGVDVLTARSSLLFECWPKPIQLNVIYHIVIMYQYMYTFYSARSSQSIIKCTIRTHTLSRYTRIHKKNLPTDNFYISKSYPKQFKWSCGESRFESWAQVRYGTRTKTAFNVSTTIYIQTTVYLMNV